MVHFGTPRCRRTRLPGRVRIETTTSRLASNVLAGRELPPEQWSTDSQSPPEYSATEDNLRRNQFSEEQFSA